MTLDRALPDIRRRLEAWSGYSVLAGALDRFDDLNIYLAGGVIRNHLMGSSAAPKDYDFFLGGNSVAAAVKHVSDHGLLRSTPYGAPRWYPTTDEAPYADLMPIAGFVPGLWPCKDMVDVLNQFDFTANAVALDLRTGQVFDPQNGVRDAVQRVMRMVRFDYPDGPYIRGALLNRNVILWFRIVHYASTLELPIEPLTLEWLLRHQHYALQHEEFTRLFFPPDLRAMRAWHERP